MEYADLLKLLEGVKSPALLVLGFIAWQTLRSAGKALDRLESIDTNISRLAALAGPSAEKIEEIDERTGQIKEAIDKLPLELIKARAATR